MTLQRALRRYFTGKRNTTEEPVKFLEAQRTFLEIIYDLHQELRWKRLTRAQRAKIVDHLNRVEREFTSMNKIRRRFRRRKEKGLPIC